MADSDPDRYATHREFGWPPGGGADQRPSHETHWEGPRAGGEDRDPRRTYYESPAQNDGLDARRTYREGSGSAGGNSGSGGGGLDDDDPDGDHPIMGLPPALRRTYTVLRELPDPGAEADVLLVRDADAGPDAAAADLKVVKVYRQNRHADHTVWAKVQTLSSRNIVRFVETGTSGGRDYEVMEYLPGGNLTNLVPGPHGLPLSMVTEVVRQVADGLAELHGLGIVHRDLKPENVLVRSTPPVDVVVTDFGLSRVPEQSVVAASRTGTLAYLSPETLLSKGAHSSKARDWWALGMIVRELLTGVRPFEEMTESAIHQALLLRPVDLGDIDDPRARLLCRGLLLRDPSDRWGAGQVREWLAGGTPPVAEESAAEASGIKPFIFEKHQYRERKALAKAFARSWDQAARRYFVAMGTASAMSSSWRALQEWLEQFADAEADDVEGLYQMIDDQLLSPTLAPDVKLLTLIQWLDPNLSPVYRGQSLDRENLAALAERVAIERDPHAEFKRIVTDLHKYDLLPRLARMRGGAGLTEVNAWRRELDGRFRQQADFYARGLSEDARQMLADADNFRRQAALLFLALDPIAHAVRLEQHTTRAAGLLPAPVPWFDQIRADALNHSNPVGHVLLVTLYPLAARESAAADQARKQREDAIRRSEEHWAEHERQRLAGAPGIPRALAYSGIITGFMLLLLISTIAGFHSVADDIGSGLVGVVVAGLIFATEGNLAQQLGADYPYYRPTAGWGPGIRRAGAHIHGAGRGCLFLFVLLLGGPILLGFAIGLPFIVFAIIGALHMQSWTRRRKLWQVQHDQQRARILGRVA